MNAGDKVILLRNKRVYTIDYKQKIGGIMYYTLNLPAILPVSSVFREAFNKHNLIRIKKGGL